MRSIKLKMILLTLSTMLILSATLGFITYRASRHALEQEATLALELLAEEGAEQLSLLMQLQLNHLEGLASRDRVRSMDWQRQLEALKPTLDEGRYLALAVVDETGIAHYIDGYTLPLGDRPYIQQSLAGESTVSEVLISRITGEPVVMLAAPIDAHDGSPAALIARLDGALLSDLTQRIRFGDRGYAYLLSGDGVFLAYQLNPEFVFQQTRVSDLVEEQPHLNHFSAFVDRALASRQGVGHYEVSGHLIYMGYSSVPGTDWILFVGASSDELFTGLLAFQQQFYAALILVLLAGLVASFLLARHFTNPVIQLEKLFTRAAGGDLSVKATPKSRDEIGKAGHSFNLMMEQIKDLTYYDGVTGLPNQRVFFSDFLRPESSGDSELLRSFLLLAPDNFRRINERFGYEEGNQLLRMTARRMEIYSGQQCSLYRGQSDEFILLCDGYETPQQAREAAHLMLQKLQEPYELLEEKVSLTFSVGMAFYPQHGETANELLKSAGFAKNLSKEKGSGLLHVYDASIHHQVLESRRMEEDLVTALENQEFHLVYQPMVHLKTGNILAVEALLRWNHPVKGLVPPDQFIPTAERTGLISKLGRWVLTEACRQHGIWKDQGLGDVVMAVNISARQFESPEFLPYLRHILKQTGMDPTRLELELTESAVIEDVSESMDRLHRLRQMGLRISIDDFGTGYSSLSYIVRLPIDTLKIDRSFIQNLEHSQQAQTIVSTIIAMGHSLNLVLVAEGIETPQQLAIIQKESCQLGQGYYFCRPEPGPKMERLLRQGTFKPKLP